VTKLARISHQPTAAAADLPGELVSDTNSAGTVPHHRTDAKGKWCLTPIAPSAKVLDVLSSTPARLCSRAPCIYAHLHALASRAGEKCGLATWVLACLLLAACATSPTGQTQLRLFSQSQMAQMGEAAYLQTKKETPIDTDPQVNQHVECVANAITRQVKSDVHWEVTVFKSKEVNAFALPGGKIGVYSGLLGVAQNQAQLAAVLGHEVGHVVAQHANARVSAQYATSAGLELIQILAGSTTSPGNQQLMGLLGLGAQVGILLPYSRSQETEADIIGLDLMARAGFDPQQSVQLWRNMERQGSGGQPPEFLSTHPSHGHRIRTLEANMPKAMSLYQQAQARGAHPSCGS
jgi:predicted Zn-dependent protease